MTRQEQQLRLKARVADAIKILGYTEFTARNVANAMHGCDKYDVLFALHALRNDGVVEQLNSHDEVFADRWRRMRPFVPYVPVQVKTQPVAEAL